MLAMIYKLGQSAERSWRRLRGFEWLAKVVEGVKFSDGIEVKMENTRQTEESTQQGRRLIGSRTPDVTKAPTVGRCVEQQHWSGSAPHDAAHH